MGRLTHSKNFRIVKDENGYKVQKYTLKNVFIFRFYKWIDFITWSGLKEVYYFETKDGALNNLLHEIKLNTLENSREC